MNNSISAQDENLRYEDYNYVDNIRSVKFNLAGLQISLPIIDLNSGGVLELSFDDIEADIKQYSYTFIHCDAHWKPSTQLTEFDYIKGYSDDQIRSYESSFNTIFAYTNYQLTLPNENMSWTKSGNYLLKIYDNTDEKKLVITRRFMVVEPFVNINVKMNYPADVEKRNTHQELDFFVNHKDFKIDNPLRNIKAVILQNANWNTAYYNIIPRNYGNEFLDFDYQDKIVFPAGKEFRWIDMRSFQYKVDNIRIIQERNDAYYVNLLQDVDRFSEPYTSNKDANGRFVIGNLDNRHEYNEDYAHVLFSFQAPIPYEDEEIYIVGAFNNWQPTELYKMTYIEAEKVYKANILLKQGYYNYQYVLVNKKDSTKVNYQALEGNWHECENDYTVLIYYHPVGQRYDRLVGITNFNSVKHN